MYIYNFVGGHNHADSVPVEDLIGTQKIETPPSGRGTVSRRRWAVNRVGLVVNSCHVAGFSGPFIGFRRASGPRFAACANSGASGSVGLEVKRDGREPEGAIRPLETDRLDALALWAVRGWVSAGA